MSSNKSKRISVTRLAKRISEQNGTGIRGEHKKLDQAAILRGNAEHDLYDREVRHYFSKESAEKRLRVKRIMSVLTLLCFVAMFFLIKYSL